ncbi:MAG: DUF1295 domain-containing protein [Gammaproteobacteria bacterium]
MLHFICLHRRNAPQRKSAFVAHCLGEIGHLCPARDQVTWGYFSIDKNVRGPVASQVLRHRLHRRGGRTNKSTRTRWCGKGFFAHSRHPLYLGNMLGIFGLLIIHYSSWAYAIGVPFSLVLYLTISCRRDSV